MLPTYKVTESTTFYKDNVISSQDVLTHYYDTLYEAATDYDQKQRWYANDYTSSDMLKEFAIYKNDKVIESFIVEQEEQA